MPSDEEQFLPWAPACREYFRNFAEGRFDTACELWFILPRARISIDAERDALVVGSAGGDGIHFCFRRGHSGVWAYYPITEDWVLKTDSLAELESGWLDGSLVV
jgi:hypothetical protein